MEIENALVRAFKRGVHVVGLVHRHRTFALPDVRRTRHTAVRLVRAGIVNLFYGPDHLFTHSKFLVRDQEAVFLGTANWIDEDVQVHPQLCIRLENKPLAEELSSYLAQTIGEQGQKVRYRS